MLLKISNKMTTESSIPAVPSASSTTAQPSKYMQEILTIYPSLRDSLTDHTNKAEFIGDICTFEETRKLTFLPNEYTAFGRPMNCTCPFTKWLEKNPTDAEKTDMLKTIEEIATLYSVIRISQLNAAHSASSDEALKYENNIAEAIIRLREIFYGEKGLWGARYGDGIICGLENLLYFDSNSPTTPFLRRLIISFSNGFSKGFN